MAQTPETKRTLDILIALLKSKLIRAETLDPRATLDQRLRATGMSRAYKDAIDMLEKARELP